MTANRWWVQRIARWLARIDGVKNHIQMVSLAVTAFSTFSIMLQGFGLGAYVPYIGITAVVLGIVYVYLYTEGGVWNQVQRDKADMSNNYADPNAKINTWMTARTLAAVLNGAELSDEQRAAGKAELDDAFEDLRDGVDLPDD
jgi:recombinational DNA repair protein (RecF pathway)